jgi:hypothetical protein
MFIWIYSGVGGVKSMVNVKGGVTMKVCESLAYSEVTAHNVMSPVHRITQVNPIKQ